MWSFIYVISNLLIFLKLTFLNCPIFEANINKREKFIEKKDFSCFAHIEILAFGKIRLDEIFQKMRIFYLCRAQKSLNSVKMVETQKCPFFGQKILFHVFCTV